MAISCLQENLSKALGVVSRASDSASTDPKTMYVLLQEDGGRLKLAATNLEIAISTWVGARIDGTPTLAVPARLFHDFASNLSGAGEQVEIAIEEGSTTMSITCGSSSAEFSGLPAEDFPLIPSVSADASITFDAQNFKQAIDRVLPAVSEEKSRPVLTGVKVDTSGQNAIVAAADGFRLSVENFSMSNPSSHDISLVIPGKTLGETTRLIGPDIGEVEFTVTENGSQALFKIGDIEIVTQLVQGEYPDYEKLLPKSFERRCILDVGDFRRAIDSASVFAREGNQIIRLISSSGEDGDSLRVTARADQMGEGSIEIPAKIEGDSGRIAFNWRYLQDTMKSDEEGVLYIETSSSSSPGLFRMEDREGCSHVIMPMYVQW